MGFVSSTDSDGYYPRPFLALFVFYAIRDYARLQPSDYDTVSSSHNTLTVVARDKRTKQNSQTPDIQNKTKKPWGKCHTQRDAALIHRVLHYYEVCIGSLPAMFYKSNASCFVWYIPVRSNDVTIVVMVDKQKTNKKLRHSSTRRPLDLQTIN